MSWRWAPSPDFNEEIYAEAFAQALAEHAEGIYDYASPEFILGVTRSGLRFSVGDQIDFERTCALYDVNEIVSAEHRRRR